MTKITMITVALVIVLGSCVRHADTQESVIAETSATASGAFLVEEQQRPAMTDDELIQMLEQLDAGNIGAISFEQYRGAKLPTPTLSRWIRAKQEEDPSSPTLYGSSIRSIPRSTGDDGGLDVAYLHDRVVFFYSNKEGAGYWLSDWMVVEKEQVHIMMLEVVRVPSLAAPNRVERSDYRYGLVHFDFETDPLVYEEWFRPDVVIEIDPDTGTLERLDEFPADWYVRVDGP